VAASPSPADQAKNTAKMCRLNLFGTKRARWTRPH
jgi:hypothetical protein